MNKSNKHGRLQTKGETIMLKHISQINYVESNQPSMKVSVDVGKDISAYDVFTNNYKMVLANIIAVGGEVHLQHNKRTTIVKHHDDIQVLKYQFKQLEYLVGRYHRLTGEYATIAARYFKDMNAAKAYFNGDQWAGVNQQLEELKKYDCIDILTKALQEIQANKLDYVFEMQEKKRRIQLQTAFAKEGIFQKHIEQELPNQEVTTPIQQLVDVKTRVGQDGAYTATSGDYTSSEVDKLEAKYVNTWYYNHEEFRVPTLDQQLAELESLREWFKETKAAALTQGTFKPTQEALAKYDRLEQLEFEVGLALDSVPVQHLSI